MNLKKSKRGGPRPIRAARPSTTAVPSVPRATGSPSPSLNGASEVALPLSPAAPSLGISSTGISHLKAPIEPSSHTDDDKRVHESCAIERTLSEKGNLEDGSSSNAETHGAEVNSNLEVDKSINKATLSIGYALAETGNENGEKSDSLIGTEAGKDGTSKNLAVGKSVTGNDEKSERQCRGENAGSVPKKRVVKRIVKVVRVVKRKVPKKVRKGDIGIESSSQATEATGILNGDQMQREGERTGNSVLVPMEVDNLNKEEDSVGEREGGLKGSDKDGDLIVCVGDRPDKLESCTEFVDKSLTFYPSAESSYERRADIIRSDGGEKEDLSRDSRDQSNEPESCVEVMEKPAASDSLAESNEECQVDNNIVSGGERVKEEAENYSNLKDEVKAGDGGSIWSGEMGALERRKRRKTEVFIGGLDKDAEEEDIRKIFAGVGEVVEVRLLKHSSTGKNKGYAFVRYACAADAKKALEKYPNVEICGKQCGTGPVEGNDTIYLGNINKKWKNEDVFKLLREIGIERIDKVTVMSDPNNTERNRGFAFVELETHNHAQVAFNKLQKKDVVGKLQGIKVAWAEPLNEPDEEEMRKVRCVYAEFIPSSWDELKVRDCFKKFGEIESVTLARNLRSSRRQDFAFISFKNRDDALACIQSFKNDGPSEDGSKVNVIVSLAKPSPKISSKKKNPGGKDRSMDSSNSKAATRAKQKQTRKNDESTQNRAFHRQVDIMSSRTAEAVQFLREQAVQRLPQAGLSCRRGSVDWDGPYTLRGIKRLCSTLGDDYFYSDPRVYSRPRLESPPAVSSRRYSTVFQSVRVVDPYHQHQSATDSSGYGYPNYQESLQREESPYYSSRTRHFRY